MEMMTKKCTGAGGLRFATDDGVPMRSNRRRSSLSAFSLLEMMVVVSIVGITAALAAPAMMSSIANRRAGEATHSVVRIGARARSLSIGFGRAHVLRFTEASAAPGGNFGTLELWRGRFDRCSANTWPTIITGACSASADCVESLDMGYYAHTSNQVRLTLDGATAGSICFQPNGDMFFSGAGGLWGTTPPAGTDAITFQVERLSGGSTAGVNRFVVFPFGGTPRILR